MLLWRDRVLKETCLSQIIIAVCTLLTPGMLLSPSAECFSLFPALTTNASSAKDTATTPALSDNEYALSI